MKLTQEDFLERAKKVHGDRYDYSKTVYLGTKKPILFICKKCCKEIKQYANDHLKGTIGRCLCKQFTIDNKELKNRIENMEFSKNYEILFSTRDTNKIKINCKKHGMFNYYLDKNNECNFCKKEKEEIKKIEERYNYDYDYSLSNFKNISEKTNVICKKHGIFTISEEYLIKGGKCPKCKLEERYELIKTNFYKKFQKKYNGKFTIINYNIDKTVFRCNNCKNIIYGKNCNLLNKKRKCEFCDYTKIITKDIFLERAKDEFCEKYEYDLSELKNSHSKIKIKCKKHNYVFFQFVYSHLNGHGCPICNDSFGERNIRMFLEKNKINFEVYKTFPNLKDKNSLSYDFYIPDKNVLIEYNGIQHYKNISFFYKTEHDWHRQLHHDWMKRKYARKNNIKLLIIKEINDINKILKEELI